MHVVANCVCDLVSEARVPRLTSLTVSHVDLTLGLPTKLYVTDMKI